MGKKKTQTLSTSFLEVVTSLFNFTQTSSTGKGYCSSAQKRTLVNTMT